MGSACSCCDFTSTKSQEITIISPKGKFSLLGFGPIQSPKCVNPEVELMLRIKNLENLVHTSSLKLKVINSGNVPKGTSFFIKAQGLENSIRNAKDGYTYFGCKRKSDNVIMNDIVIPLKDRELTASQRGQTFVVYYKIESDSYWIKDLGKGYSAFVKIPHAMVKNIQTIKNNWMINIGESFLVMSIDTTHISAPRLSIKKFSGSDTGNIKQFIFRSFEASEYFDSQISIGRGKGCHIEMDDYLLSKVQCSIFYELNSGWTIIDGDYSAGKESTNGTWLYIADELEITNGMVIKSYQTLMQATILN